MDYGEIKAALTANLGGESATDLHPQEARVRAIQQAYRDITLDQEIGQGSMTLSLPALSTAINVPVASIMISPDGITNSRGFKLAEINIEDLTALKGNNLELTGDASYYALDTERGGFLQFFPRSPYPQTLTVNYLANPSPMTQDSDRPWGGRYETFHNLIPLKAAQFLYREKGLTQEDMQASRFWLSEYEREVARLKRFIRREEGGMTQLRIATSPRSNRRRKGWWDE